MPERPNFDAAAIQLRTQLLQCRASLFDPDTRLPNLAAVLDQVRKLLDERGLVQVLLIRIEQEQSLERAVGWEHYDRLLRAVADRLRDVLANGRVPSAVLCQDNVRGDHFLVFTADRAVLGHIIELLAQGVAVCEPDASESTVLQLRMGEGGIRRQVAQRVERSIYAGIFEAQRDFMRRGEELDEERRRQLRSMLSERSVTTLFQPIFRLPQREVLGWEALSRGPAGSYLEMADNLFGFAERAGVLGEVEQLCFERALVNGKRLPAGAIVFLNLSFRGLEHLERGEGGLTRVVQRGGWAPDRVVLEITERTYAENPAEVRSRLQILRRQGFRVAIDDMGTGYSSLNVVADLEPDFIKLDHMLVDAVATEPIKRNLVSAITTFARDSGVAVIAEGVERADDVEVLSELGVTLQQGFYLAYPRPV